MNRRHGFTVLELTVVVGVIAILSAASVPAFQGVQRRMQLNNATQELVDVLRVARTRAVTASLGTSHGVRFFSDRYELFNNQTGDVEVRTLPAGLTLNPSVGFVTFSRLSGEADGPATLIVERAGQTRTIAISANGTVRTP